MYHATPAENVSSILKYGLKPKNNLIYMSETAESSKLFAQDVLSGAGEHRIRTSSWALFDISLAGLTLTDFTRDPDSGERNYYAIVEQPIPPDHLRLIEYFTVRVR